MDTPWNVGDNLSVTLQMQTQYAAYRVKKILLENENVSFLWDHVVFIIVSW